MHFIAPRQVRTWFIVTNCDVQTEAAHLLQGSKPQNTENLLTSLLPLCNKYHVFIHWKLNSKNHPTPHRIEKLREPATPPLNAVYAFYDLLLDVLVHNKEGSGESFGYFKPGCVFKSVFKICSFFFIFSLLVGASKHSSYDIFC